MKTMQKNLFTFVVSLTILFGCAQNKLPLPAPIIKTTEIQTQPIIEDDVITPTEINLLNDNKDSITNVKSRYHGKGKHAKKFLVSSTFNFSYSGDVAGVVNAFVDYDPSINIYKSIGKVWFQNISIELNNTNITAIAEYIDKATNGRVKLTYFEKQNSLRLTYDSTITVANDALKQSQIWQDGGTPSPVLSKDGIVLFPYGQYEPKITCQPLQLCDIQLQAGETVKGLMIGDSVRWNEGDGAIPVVYSGSDSKPIPHVVLKPTYPGLNTTLLVTTDKRTYYIKLVSSDSANLSRVGFYYPSEQIQQFDDKRAEAKAKDDEILTDGAFPNIDPRNMHFNYKVSGDTDAAFNPVQVFDDGTHVYIQMSDSVRTNELPAFYVLGADGETLELVNFSYKKPFYIVNKLFNKGVLVLGLDSNQQKITISKK
ncbi:MAG: P-type conjugative transfer protein TrbG [Burkholderiales bacterium]|nr:P-type conjugative transfer protein TrbG [Burkholderiales bacterium]